MKTITLNAETLTFFEYLRTFKRKYFGRNSIGIVGFIGIYLNYDTDYNPFRQAILNGMPTEGDEQEETVFKTESEMTKTAIKFIKNLREEITEETFLNESCFLGKGVKISKNLEEAVKNAVKVETDNIHEFMYHVLNCKSNCNLVNKFFKESFGLSYNYIMKHSEGFFYKLYDSKKMIQIPEKYAKYVKEIDGRREDYKLFSCDDVKDNLWNSMLKFEGNNVVIASEYEDLAHKFIYNMAYELEHDISCTTRPYKTFFEVELQKIFLDVDLEDKTYVTTLKDIVKFFISIENKENFVVYFKNSDLLLNSGADGFSYIFHFYPLFMDEDIKVFLDLDSEELKAVCAVHRFLDAFELLVLAPPTKEEFIPYMMGNIFELSVHHGVYANEKSVQMALQFVKAMEFDGHVRGTRNLMDFAMAFANSVGRNVVSQHDFIEYFKINFKAQDKQNDEFKRLVAYHEAGHFVISRFAKHYTAVYSDLVSVVSISGLGGITGGVNIMEFDNNELRGNDFNFYLESLALTLGGRASEEMFMDSISAGAVSDLDQATELATAMVANFGLDKSKKIKGNENLTSEKSLNEVSEKVDEILAEAYELAMKMISDHKEYVETLAKKLMQKKIISRKEIMEMEVTTEDGKIIIK
jgi:hypothetical protein